ncbi:hypothetical protein BS618_32970 [Rhodococcus erythropolis]|nr:hypothetical protein BS618_32970 [Rhodococcus erythropolis]
MRGRQTKTAIVTVGVITIAVVASTGTALAARYIELPWTNTIYQVSSRENQGKTPTVSMFDHDGNKCYVVTGAQEENYRADGDHVGISCVRSN